MRCDVMPLSNFGSAIWTWLVYFFFPYFAIFVLEASLKTRSKGKPHYTMSSIAVSAVSKLVFTTKIVSYLNLYYAK